ncbi:hypothetical protein P691DRAFT_786545 [Macrolepiota fuliginosa MF-IS2]|uniref:Transmembrane protein n=1 Tax=Macrolepiota fuliginosa MF-IS2 TaxID=1400762 RepID=A0A9P5X497_9AGAR|nr:hypothetical protein P691DRAFT_786545 [Macrolepiota fuliginosa MF-IS2]
MAIKEAKAIMTTIAVIWHSSATLVAKDVVLVSTATSGLLAQIKHFVSRSTTTYYRVAFSSLLLLMAMGAIGPAVIIVNTVLMAEPETIQLSDLTLVDMFGFVNSSFVTVSSGSQERASDRADLVLRMEVVENYTYGYQTSNPRLLIPWPQQGFQDGLHYTTDVISYNYECSWYAPQGNLTVGGVEPLQDYVLDVNGTAWGMETVGSNMPIVFSRIDPTGSRFVFPLTMFSPPVLPRHSTSPISGYLFMRGRDVGDPVMGPALVWATRPNYSDGPDITYITDKLFWDPSTNTQFPPPKINDNMNAYMQIAAKAYLGGLVTTEDSSNQVSQRKWIPQNASFQQQQPVLTASAPFLLLQGIIFGCASALLSGLLIMTRNVDLRPFDLHTLTVRGENSILSQYKSGTISQRLVSGMDGETQPPLMDQ